MPATPPPPVHGPRTGPATQQDVALAAGVSRGLVSLALKGEGRMSDETRRRILSTARALGYRTNTAAAELAARRSSRLAVIVPYLDNPFFDVLLRRLRRHAADADHVLVAFVSDLEDSLEHTTVDDVLSMRPAGLLLPGTSMSEDELTALAEQVPLCVIDRDLEAGTVPVVRLDEADAARRIAAHLVSQGLTSLAFFSPAPGLQELLLDERRGACRAAAGAAGLAFTEVTCDDGASSALARARAELGAPPGRGGLQRCARHRRPRRHARGAPGAGTRRRARLLRQLPACRAQAVLPDQHRPVPGPAGARRHHRPAPPGARPGRPRHGAGIAGGARLEPARLRAAVSRAGALPASR